MFQIPYAEVVCVNLTSHQLRIQLCFLFFGNVLLCTSHKSQKVKKCKTQGATKAVVHVWVWELAWGDKQERSIAEQH